jgi:hypothetical protein
LFGVLGFDTVVLRGKGNMVERKIELRRRYKRKDKMKKLKAKLAAAKDSKDREKILYKIHCLSPSWQEPKAESA